MYIFIHIHGFVSIHPQRQCCNAVVCTPPHVIILLLKLRSSCLFPLPRKGRGAVAAHLCLECGAASLECSLEWGCKGLRQQLQPSHVFCSCLGTSSMKKAAPGAHSHLTLGTSWGLGTFIRSQRQFRLSLTTGSSASLGEHRLFPVNSHTPIKPLSDPHHPSINGCALPCTFQMAGVFLLCHIWRLMDHFCTTPSQINHKYTSDLPQGTSS